MKKLILISTILLLTVISLFAKQVRFDPIRGIVEVDVLIDGEITGRFGIDTGTDRIYIDNKFAVKNNIEILQALGQRNIQGIDGSTRALKASLATLQITDDVTLTNVNATVVDMAKLSKSGVNPDGLIGYQILKQFYVSIDYPNKLLELTKEEPDFLRGRKYTEIPFTLSRHFILVDVVINNELTVPMMLDYCASYTTITPELAAQLEVPILENRRAILKSINIEGVEAKDVRTYVSDLKKFKRSTPRAKFKGIIGGSFLSKFNITVDYSQKKIYIRD